ncbi:MAG: hypothetical protein QOG68_595 [Solirubrobacteraceae bacterium]|jgi:hypothetical protein|nr:hypothetical protein [Solirubrobacteraceae bacterium]
MDAQSTTNPAFTGILKLAMGAAVVFVALLPAVIR